MTDRELEVLMLAGSGHSVPEMAELLGISPLTVENLKRRIYAKLDVNSGAHAVSTAASLGILDRRAAPAMRHREPPSEDFPVLTVVSGQPGATLDQVVRKLLASAQPFVLVGDRRNISHSHWARWHRGPIIAALVDPEPADWGIVEELSVPAILVHSKPLDSGEVADALANGASSLVQAETIEDHFLSVLRMAGQGYLVVDSKPMRPLIGAVRARWERQAPGSGSDLPELTARECDILRYGAEGYSIRQTPWPARSVCCRGRRPPAPWLRRLQARCRRARSPTAGRFGTGAEPLEDAPPGPPGPSQALRSRLTAGRRRMRRWQRDDCFPVISAVLDTSREWQ